MQVPPRAPGVNDSPGSPQTDNNDVASFSNLPSPDQDLRMLTRYENKSSRCASASTVQPQQQMESESADSTRLSDPANILGKPSNAQSSSPKSNTRRAAFWKTVGTITGFFLTASFAALGHYILFKKLNGKPVDTCSLTQTQVLAVSVLLSTTFKAALTASMGTCFAQHLWFLLRERAMSLSTIENLFVIRTNIIAFGNLRRIWRAPLLFLMALLIWCLGLATIYPPSALVITIEAYTYTEHHNMSIMNPPVPPEMDPNGWSTYPTLGAMFRQQGKNDRDGKPLWEQVLFNYRGPPTALINIAQSVIISDQIFTLPMHPGENSTYILQFRSPNFRCKVKHYNDTLPLQYTAGNREYKELVYVGDTLPLQYVPYWIPPSPLLTARTFRSGWDSKSLIFSSERHKIGHYAAYRNPDNSTKWEAFAQTEQQVCEPFSVLHHINVTFPRGVQDIQYISSDAKALAPNNYTDGLGPSLSLPPKAQALQDWYDELFTLLPISNEWTLLDALGAQLNFSFYEATGSPSLESESGDCERGETMANGTVVYDCQDTYWDWEHLNKTKNDASLKGTVFHMNRFDPSFYTLPYNPRTDLNLTEDMLNDVLTKIAISAISLGTWWDVIPVTKTRYRSTYTLSNPLNLILPYSICLGAAIIFAAIATWSLWHNRATAADGGFLQIMMATVGNTKLSRIILEEGATAIDDMSDNLKSLKIRYGELVKEDVLGVGGKRFGFDAATEGISPRKRK